MRWFDRSILTEIGRNTALIFFALTVVLATLTAVRLLARASGGELPADLLWPYFFWAMVDQMTLLGVLASFAAALLTLQRWVRDQEWVVWRSLGVSRLRLGLPLMAYALLVAILVLWLKGWASPYAETRKDLLKAQAQARDETQTIVPGIFRDSNDGRRSIFVLPADSGVRQVFLRQWQGDRQVVVLAHSARIVERDDGRWLQLHQGARYQEGEAPLAWRLERFAEQSLWIAPPEIPAPLQRRRADPLPEVWADRAHDRSAAAELVARLGYFFVPIVLIAGFALPLAESEPRSLRGALLGLALLVFLLYFNLLSVAHSLALKGTLEWPVALAIPPLAMVVLALGVLIWRYRRLP